MKRKSSLFFCVLFILTFALSDYGMSVVWAAPTTAEQLEAAENEYNQTQENYNEQQDNLSQLSGEKNQLVSSLGELNEKLQGVSNILDELELLISDKNEEIDSTWGRIEELATQIDATKTSLDERYELIKAHIKFIYETGGDYYSILASGSEDYSDYINRSSFVQMLTEYEQSQLELLKQNKDILIAKQAEYESSLVEYEEEIAQLAEYEIKVNEQLDSIEAMIDKTALDISAYEDKIEDTQAQMLEYEKSLERQENNIEALKTQIEEEKRISAEAEKSGWKDVTGVSVSAGDKKLLANIIYCEAGSEPYVGKVAVGAVVMNRVRSELFPDTIVGVIYQKRQFSPVASGRLALALANDSADEDCYKAAEAALNGVTNVNDCLYFRTPVDSVTPKYVIGGHIFY